MTTHKQQDQRVILIRLIRSIRSRCRLFIPWCLNRVHRLSAPLREFATQGIGHAATGNLDQPPTRIVGHAIVGPLDGGREQSLLYRVLGGGEVPEPPQHRTENLRRKLAQQVLVRVTRLERHTSPVVELIITGRTSMGMCNGAPPGPGAADARAAIS